MKWRERAWKVHKGKPCGKCHVCTYAKRGAEVMRRFGTLTIQLADAMEVEDQVTVERLNKEIDGILPALDAIREEGKEIVRDAEGV